MIYRAEWLLPLDAPPMAGGWIQVEDECIAACGTADIPRDAEVRELPGCAILPGLINAHCHLELNGLDGKLPRGVPFPTWVEGLRGFTAALDFENHRAAAREGIFRLLRGGATTVVDVGNTGAALPALAQSSLRGFALVEVLGLDPSLAPTRFESAQESARRWENSSKRLRTGLSAHAAYSCSPELFSEASAFQIPRGPFTFHAAESVEEAELFASASGALAEYCRSIFPGAPRHQGLSPIAYLESQGLLPERSLIVHGNTLSSADIAVLKKRQAAVVHCPSSHAFFGHPPFPYAALRAAGIPVCLGTDSPASGDSLSMLDQVRFFRRAFPEVGAREALRMSTETAARALGMGSAIGSLKAGFQADFIAVRAKFGDDPHETILEKDSEAVLSVIGGKEASTL